MCNFDSKKITSLINFYAILTWEFLKFEAKSNVIFYNYFDNKNFIFN